MKRCLVIGDIHFGIKTNSLIWFEYQNNLFKKQIIPIIENKNIDTIIFLGDLFDIRYSINQQIGYDAKEIVVSLFKRFSDKQFIFLAGNHDYYSPLEELSKYNIYDLLFDDEFRKTYKNVKFICNEPYFQDGALFLPWYFTENPNHFDSLLYNYKFGIEVKSIYCHTDLSIWPGSRITSLRGCPVYSGHIHNIIIDEENHLYNLGSAMGFTFSDVDEVKYLYIIEDHAIVEKIPNTTTPMFKRIFNEDIFTISDSDIENSFVQLCVSSSNINKANYIDQIKYIKDAYSQSDIKVRIIEDKLISSATFNSEGINTNVSQFIDDNMPEYLQPKYAMIKDRLKEK
jgi:hypothetical protein